VSPLVKRTDVTVAGVIVVVVVPHRSNCATGDCGKNVPETTKKKTAISCVRTANLNIRKNE